MIRGERILITGGAGFIGSNLAERLKEENTITILDDLSTGSTENISSLAPDKFVKGSITDADLVERLAADNDIIVHLAAVMGVRRTLEQPLDVMRVNIEGTKNVLNAAAQAGIDRVLVASTSEVYGDAPEPPYTEVDETAPKTDYAVAKLADERLAHGYQREYGLDYTIIRYFNVYGPRQDASAYGYVVPIFVRQALADEPVTVHGSGEQTRDFTFISDAIDCTVRSLSTNGKNETFNIGCGREISIRELAETVRNVVGDVSIEHQEHPRPYTVERRCADISKAQNLLGYTPKRSLEEGIREMISNRKDTTNEINEK